MFAMSDSFWNGLWTFAGLVAALLIKQYFDQQSRNKINEKLNGLHESTNGMSIRLEAVSKAQGTAEGRAAGLAQGRAESLASEQDRHTPAT
jgi:H+/Cl- antiporter ClcA